MRRILCSMRSAYEADRKYYRDLIVRVIEDAVVLYMMFAGCWGLAWVLRETLQLLGAAP